MDTPIKKCHYCGREGSMPTFSDGETICYQCMDKLPMDGRKCRQEIVNLRKALAFEEGKNEFDAKRLRRLCVLLGLSVPESDETLLGCAGTVLGQACYAIEQRFKTPNAELCGPRGEG